MQSAMAFLPFFARRRFGPMLALALAGCTTASPVVHAPPPPPPVAAAAPPSSPVIADWRDRPLTAGRWRYVPGDPVSSARYGEDGASPALVLRCDRRSGQVALLRSGSATAISVTTSSGVTTYKAGAVDDGGVAMSGALFAARDGFLDKFAFSRGRMMIASPGLPAVVVPAWAEPARAIEDCRK
jgi:hypothetical protein